MKICELTNERLAKFFEFNQRINPTQPHIVERLQWQIFDNPRLANAMQPCVLLATNDQNQLIGQHLHNPMEYHWGGKTHCGFFGYDFYVDSAYRGQGIGKALAAASDQKFFPHWGLGVAERSKKILLALKNRVVGKLYIFVWLRNPLFPLHLAKDVLLKSNRRLKKLTQRPFSFPAEVMVGGRRFRLVDSLPQPETDQWPNDVLRFSRSSDFLQWRFFHPQHRYAAYVLDDPGATTYLVVRMIRARGLYLLALVDYHVPYGNSDRFRLIVQAAKLLARLTRADGVFTMSSYQMFDEDLRQERFFKRRQPIDILTNAPLVVSPKRIERRQFMVATMADSDLDFYFDFI
ncbi:MAG: GNAT family N-acetyltransferase [candidate division KSB1 bacterium]|nr:GNAT family N-acetyltransferase [candidate division KSB1 bacterium]